MRRFTLAVALAICSFQFGRAQQPELPTEPIVCRYARLAERQPFAALDPNTLTAVAEVEPNDSHDTAQTIPLGFEDDLDPDVDLNGTITPFDQDFFEFEARRGEVLGVAVLAVDANQLDSRVSVHGADGSILVLNEDHQIGSTKIADLYPPESPLPAGGLRRDSILSFAVPADGTYFVRVDGSGASSGGYFAQLRLRQPPLRLEPMGTRQSLFLDFDGATVNAELLFGDGGLPTSNLSPLKNFLAGWGIAENREDDLIDAIVANVQAHFDQLLNPVGTTVGIEIRNSKDHADNFGPSSPFVSRVIIGGSIAELGIGTIGIAECIDPGNFSTNDTAVVLLDLLSAPASNPNSVLSLEREPGVSVEDAVARIVAAIICHEAGHFLGCWHTDNDNDVGGIIDQGGSIANTAGVGSDNVLNADDPANRFIRDFYAFEGIARTFDHENVDARVLSALAIGQAPSADESTDATEVLLAGLEAQESRRHTPSIQPFNLIRRAVGLDESVADVPPRASRIGQALKDHRAKLEFLKK